MRIEAITCCVGELYASQLALSLDAWAEGLDSLVVVTKHGDWGHTLVNECGHDNVRAVTTNVFTEFGAHFNKGAALCEAYQALDPADWVLHFDADIIPPDNWRQVLEKSQLKCGHLYGAPRSKISGDSADNDERFHPYGYFQLWNIYDPCCWRWPIFDTWHPHAGSYDANFMDQWPQHRWKRLMMTVTHQGEPRSNWFGTDKKELMQPLLDRGLYKYRMDCKNKGTDRLDVPKPRLKFNLGDRNPQWCVDTLRACMIGGPFLVQAGFQEPRTNRVKGIETLHRSNPFTQTQERVLECLKS